MQLPGEIILVKSLFRILLITLIACSSGDPPSVTHHAVDKTIDPGTFMWYEAPAKKWEDALPVGNGRLGAMVYGRYGEEIIQLNEDTRWSGGPYSATVKGGHKKLAEIQKLIFEGKPIRAHKLFGRHLMGYPVEQQKYQSLGNFHLFFQGEDTVTNYRRSLDLKTGIAAVTYQANGVQYTREIIASEPDQTIAIRLTADQKGSISCVAEYRGIRNVAHSNYGTDYFRMDDVGSDQLRITGRSADYLGIAGKLRYDTRVRAVPKGGSMTIGDDQITIQNADTVTFYVVAATNFVNYKDVSADETERVERYLTNLEKRTVTDIFADAVKDYQHYFNRVTLTLPTTDQSYLPTNVRMDRIQSSPDPNLASLSYQFGRYLLISSSRPGTEAANLQGIWNQDMNPKWDSKYTTNINLQMNYWPVETANLSELFEPLQTLVTELTDQGADVAREHYGARGWVFHQNTDIWRVAAPMDGPTWGTFTVGGAWLTTHLWEHYLFTQDMEYLKTVYPVMKGSVQFFLDFLVEHPNGKWLVTNPSNSPENPPDGPGYKYFYDEVPGFYYFTTITYGATIDTQILKDLFRYFISASTLLKRDPAMADQVRKTLNRLVPSQVGKDGTLQEWTEDYGQLEDKHRHFSHLYGLYPGNVISAKRTPELVEPVKQVLEQRGDGGTGFSRGWKMALWARLYDGNRAHQIYKGYLKDQCYMSLFAKCFTPLQVDGSLGVTAGITEMLIQSHEDQIDLLPALPDDWPSGSFTGVKARGGFEIDFAWENGALTRVSVRSTAGKKCRIMLPTGLKEFDTVKGQRYEIYQK